MGKDNDDSFGDLFDFNGDGETDVFEEAAAFTILEDAADESEEENDELDEIDDPEEASDYESGYYHTSSSRPVLSGFSLSNRSNAASDPAETKEPAIAEHPLDPASEYKTRKRNLTYAVLGILLFFIVWVGLFLMIMESCTMSNWNGIAIRAGLIMGIVCFIIFYAIWIHPLMAPVVKKYRSAKKAWVMTLDEAGTKKLRRKRGAVIAAVTAVILGAIAAVITPKIVKASKDSAVLSEARGIMAEGRYADARQLLRDRFPSDHEASKVMIDYCDAHIIYAEGDPARAYYRIYRDKLYLLGPELNNEATAFLEVLKEETTAYYEEQEILFEQKSRENENKIRSGVPFVGMFESLIGDTSLGKPDPNVRRTLGTYGGEEVIFKRYDFIRNNKIIFSAYCYNDKVVMVKDQRDSPIPTKKPSSSSGSGSSYIYPDPKEFDEPSDFYYWYCDEFVDYEEAEEYYYSHGGR